LGHGRPLDGPNESRTSSGERLNPAFDFAMAFLLEGSGQEPRRVGMPEYAMTVPTVRSRM
jgi:hypothetical protein